MIWRALVALAGAGVIAAATHANVNHAGGYGSQDAPLIITIAVLLAVGIGYCGILFNDGLRIGALVLGLCILAGEIYWVCLNAEREIANRAELAAPVAQATAARAAAMKRLEDAKVAKSTADAAAISEASKRYCRKNCRDLLIDAKEKAASEVTTARYALSRLPEPLSSTPDRLGFASWAWDLVMAGLRSLAVVGASLAIGLAVHPRRRSAATEPTKPDSIQVTAYPVNKRQHVAQFLSSTLRPDPTSGTSLREYGEWCARSAVVPLPAGELGEELNLMFGAIGLECKRLEHDVIVEGTAIAD